jgi:hypothetical protein
MLVQYPDGPVPAHEQRIEAPRLARRRLRDPFPGAVVAAVYLQPTHPTQVSPFRDVAADQDRSGLQLVAGRAMGRADVNRGSIRCHARVNHQAPTAGRIVHMSEALILDEVRQKFDRQQRRLDDVRSRAATMLGSAAVVSGLFGFRIASDDRTGWQVFFLVVALIAFVEVVASTVAIAWPIKGWDDGQDGHLDRAAREKVGNSRALSDRVGGPASLSARETNESLVEFRTTLFRWACGSLGLEVICWALAVGL